MQVFLEAKIRPNWDWNISFSKPDKASSWAKIRPNWDWNWYGWTHRHGSKGAKIRPNWDWNRAKQEAREQVESC